MSVFPPNATIKFWLPTGEGTVNEQGNVSGAMAPLTCQAYLRRDGAQSGGDAEGFTLGRTKVVGYLVEVRLPNGDRLEPPRLPSRILPGSKGDITMFGQFSVEGEFFLEESIPATFDVLDAVLGAKIRGYLLRRTIWGEGMG